MVLHTEAAIPHAEVHLEVVQQAFAALKDRRRALAGRTGCGVCGIESIDLLDLAPERVPVTGFLERLAPDALAQAARALPAHQALTRLTGGLHAAAWCDASGAIQAAFEDVGRHNALDKLIGELVLKRADLTDGFVFLSSRASYELVRKAGPGRHSAGGDDLGALLAGDRDREGSGPAPGQLLPRIGLRRLRHGLSVARSSGRARRRAGTTTGPEGPAAALFSRTGESPACASRRRR